MTTIQLTNKVKHYYQSVEGTWYNNPGYEAEDSPHTDESTSKGQEGDTSVQEKNTHEAKSSTELQESQPKTSQNVQRGHIDSHKESRKGLFPSAIIITREDEMIKANSKENDTINIASDNDRKAKGSEGKVFEAGNTHSRSDDVERPQPSRTSDDEQSIPDGGWGYIVALGTFVNMMIAAFVGPCFGILFSDFLMTTLETTSTMVTWTYNLKSFVWNIMPLLVAPSVDLVGWRMVVFVSGLACCLGMCISAFAPSAWYLLLSYSLFIGSGAGTSAYVSFSILPYYFSRRRGRAFAVLHAGFAIGNIVGPPFITYLQEEFGYQGATLLVGAISLNSCVCAAIYRPVEWKNNNSMKNKESGQSFTRAVAAEYLRAAFRSLALNFKIMKSAQALMISISFNFAIVCFIQVYSLVPFVIRSRGYTQTEASWCLTLTSTCNLVFRLIPAVLSDSSWFNKRACCIAGFAIMAISTLVFSLVWDLKLMAVMMAMFGVGSGAANGLYQLCGMSYLGLEKYSAYLSVTGVFTSFCFLGSGPLLGMIADATGSYTASLWVLVAFLVLSFILWLLMPVAIAYDARNKEKQRERDEEHARLGTGGANGGTE